MLLTGPSEPPPTAIIPHRMKPHVAPPEPLREATEVVPTVAPVAPAATPPEVSIHKTVGPHPASAGASLPAFHWATALPSVGLHLSRVLVTQGRASRRAC